MKKILMIVAMIIGLSLSASGQTMSQTEVSKTADYSQFVLNAKSQIWSLQGVVSNENYTGVFIRINIKNNKGGSFRFPKNIYISGEFGTLYPIGLQILEKDWELDKWWYYGNGNKNTKADCLVLFDRIPAGVSQISYCLPNYILWDNIPVIDNPNTAEVTQWTEPLLRNHWEETGITPIEGIYYFTITNKKEWWGDYKHTLAAIKDDYQYKLIYLKGSNPKIWKEGEVKATFVPTATPGLYKVTNWLMENKMSNDNMYLVFKDGMMSVYEGDKNITADFLKLYPAYDINMQQASSGNRTISKPQAASSSTQHKSSGSGIFVSSKIIATNYHVIDEASRVEVMVKTGNSISSYAAKVLCSDKTNDLALLSIDDSDFNGIGELPFVLSMKSREVGTSIFTMGYPMAEYMGDEVKITDGIISSKTGYDGDIVTYQISAPIQPGSSGGPLFDRSGNLIGITNAGIMSAQNVGYAIKSSYLYNLIESAPVAIDLPANDKLVGKDLIEQIKILAKYVVFIKVY